MIIIFNPKNMYLNKHYNKEEISSFFNDYRDIILLEKFKDLLLKMI